MGIRWMELINKQIIESHTNTLDLFVRHCVINMPVFGLTKCLKKQNLIR